METVPSQVSLLNFIKLFKKIGPRFWGSPSSVSSPAPLLHLWNKVAQSSRLNETLNTIFTELLFKWKESLQISCST